MTTAQERGKFISLTHRGPLKSINSFVYNLTSATYFGNKSHLHAE